jgi:hypothetical protein
MESDDDHGPIKSICYFHPYQTLSKSLGVDNQHKRPVAAHPGLQYHSTMLAQ